MTDKKITESCGNIFADIGLPNAEEILVKAQIAHKIEQEIKNRNLTQAKAAKLMDIPQPRVSQIINGNFHDISEHKLMHCLNKLGYNINIKIEPETRSEIGHITLAFA
ncbi:MAG: XRE family transcriptional regulator [Proteobacteria bacterium]|nr:MAG: XRE family transcriptional regulator [Pseudomonadota bacterium]